MKAALPAALSSPAFSVTGEGGVLEVSGSTTVSARVGPGNGTVEFTEAVGTAAITGAGNVAFSGTLAALQGTITAKTAAFTGAVTTVAALTIDADTVSFADAVTTAAVSTITATTFGGAVGIATGAAAFNGPVVFKDGLTLTAVGAAFKGPAFFADGKKITLTTDASVITLKPGAGLAHGTATAIPTVYSAILGNIGEEDDVTLTPGANTTLTFGAAATKSITQAGTAGHSIEITGTAALFASATYTLASESSKIGTLEVATGAELHIDDGVLWAGAPGGCDNTTTSAKLVLTGATGTNGALLKGAGSVVAGGTAIAGGTNGWQAVATSETPTITIEADTITASADTAALTAVTGETQPSITVAAGETLTIAANTTIDLLGSAAKVGSIVLKGAASGADGGTLAFAKGTTSVVKTANSAGSAGTAGITGAAIGAGRTLSDTGTSNYYLVSITSEGNDDAHTIQATTEATDVTLDGSTVAGS